MNISTNLFLDIIQTANSVAKIVGSTLGPKGKNVILFNSENKAFATKDGVSVAKHLKSDEPVKDAIIQVIRESALKTAEEAGDGTTTTTLLAGSLISNGYSFINSDKSAAVLKKEIQDILPLIYNKLEELTIPISINFDTLKYIASTSANNDETIGEIVANAFIYADKTGLVSFELSPTSNTYIEKLEGTQIDNGIISKDFITDKKKMQTTLDNAQVILIRGSIDSWKHLLPIAKSVKETPTVIVAFDFSEDTLRGIIRNNYQGFTNILPIKLTGYSANREDLLSDLGAITTAKVCTLSTFNTSYIGTIQKVISTQTNTTFVLGDTIPSSFTERVAELEAHVEESKIMGDSFVKAAEKRLAKFVGKIATIYVGGNTEVEAKERYDRVEDAVCATKAAIEEGICAGGATTFINISRFLKDSIKDKSDGCKLLIEALQAPFKTLCENADKNYNEIINVINDKQGYDFNNDKPCNMIDSGIIDPSKVIRVAIENAVSVALVLLNTSCIENEKSSYIS